MVENHHFIQLVMKTVQPAAPHVGQMMDKHMRQHRYHKAALARKIAVNYTTVVNFMRSPDNRVSYIWNICHALRYNFLSDLAAQLPPDMPCAPTLKDQRITELEQQVQQLTQECATLQRVIDTLRPK
jgi:hypothetical protein